MNTLSPTPATDASRKPFYYLRDFEAEHRMCGRRWKVKCPLCGKWHCFIDPQTGLYNCFTPGCEFHGLLRDFWQERYRPSAADTPRNRVRPRPDDFRRLPDEIEQKIYALDTPHADAKEEAARQRVLAYLSEQRISLQTAMEMRVGYCRHYCPGGKDGGGMHPCIVYRNTLNRRLVNAKYRAVDEKLFFQDSAKNESLQCPPFNMDCLNPLLRDEETVPLLVVTEGEKDAVAVREAGYACVISVPNGASAKPERVFEPFADWLHAVERVVLCGDADLPGRELTANLSEYFADKAYITQLPADCKDIADVLRLYGTPVVQQVINEARAVCEHEVIAPADEAEGILRHLRGDYDHGTSIGYGAQTDRIYKYTAQGGLMIVTGKPNSGKTDFLDDFMVHHMLAVDSFVAFLSFEVKNKQKHMAHLVQLLTGKRNTDIFSNEELGRYIDFLNRHIRHIDTGDRPATPKHILELADGIRRRHPLKFLIVDPYLFMELNPGREETETQAIKRMLTVMQRWGREHGVWVVIVAHPHALKKKTGKEELEEIDMYTISGSAHWANLADYILTVCRVKTEAGEDDYTRIDMLKVRDQDICSTGTVCYRRGVSGCYSEVN